MFNNLSDKLGIVFKRMKGLGHLSEKDISEGLKHIRTALLEADVNYRVAKNFVEGITKRALGQEVMASLAPGQQIIKIVNEEMSRMMGGSHHEINLKGVSPVSLMIVGLQGSGKTTTAGKLAVYLKSKGNKPYLVPLDIYRPAAIDQLKVISGQVDVPVFESEPHMDPVDICRNARISAAKSGCDVMLLDTAGRLYSNEKLMQELVDIKIESSPSDILLVVDAMSGQDAVSIAKSFEHSLDIGGIVLSKMDSDARGGAALSMKAVTGKPIKFIGVGEKLHELEPFHPDRMASRILGMGDLLTIMDKAKMALDEKKVAALEKKIKKNRFSLEDFRDQIIQVKKMGSLTDLIGMIPGIGNMKHMRNLDVDDTELIRIEAIINSMTAKERDNYSIINGSRRKRIARGSGTKVQDVNRLLKNYIQVTKVMKKINRSGIRDVLPF